MEFETWYDAEQAFDEILDDYYPQVSFGWLYFAPSQIWKNCAPIAYRTRLLDWLDAEGIDTDELEGSPSC